MQYHHHNHLVSCEEREQYHNITSSICGGFIQNLADLLKTYSSEAIVSTVLIRTFFNILDGACKHRWRYIICWWCFWWGCCHYNCRRWWGCFWVLSRWCWTCGHRTRWTRWCRIHSGYFCCRATWGRNYWIYYNGERVW